MDGIYLVTIANGVKLEAYDQTLASRNFDSASNVYTTKTAAWRGNLYNAPMPCLTGGNRDDIRNIAISALQRAHPDDLYWADDPQNKKQRQNDRIKMEKVYHDYDHLILFACYHMAFIHVGGRGQKAFAEGGTGIEKASQLWRWEYNENMQE